MSDQLSADKSAVPEKKKFFDSVKSKVILGIIIITAVLISIKGIAIAQHIHKHGGDPVGMIIGRISEKLDLNQAQNQQLEKIRDDIRQKMDSKKQNRESDFETFANEFRNNSIDRNKLIEIAEKREKDREEMRNFMMDKLIEFHSMLTSEQRSKVIEVMKDMKDKFGPGKGPGDRPDRDTDDRFRRN